MKIGKVPRVTCDRCGRSLAVRDIKEEDPQPRRHFCDHRVHCTPMSECVPCAVVRAENNGTYMKAL